MQQPRSDGIGGQDVVGQPGGDGCARHAENDAGLLVLGEDAAAGLVDGVMAGYPTPKPPPDA